MVSPEEVVSVTLAFATPVPFLDKTRPEINDPAAVGGKKDGVVLAAKVPVAFAEKLSKKPPGPRKIPGVIAEKLIPRLREPEASLPKKRKSEVYVMFWFGVEAAKPPESAPVSPERVGEVAAGVMIAVNKFVLDPPPVPADDAVSRKI